MRLRHAKSRIAEISMKRREPDSDFRAKCFPSFFGDFLCMSMIVYEIVEMVGRKHRVHYRLRMLRSPPHEAVALRFKSDDWYPHFARHLQRSGGDPAEKAVR